MPAPLLNSLEVIQITVKDRIKRHARVLGFDDCRVTSAAPPDSSNRFEQWIAEGRHGEMGYMARNTAKRTDLQKVLPGARSVITLAVSYEIGAATGNTHLSSEVVSTKEEHTARNTQYAIRNTPHGIIARYARFQDYHDIIGKRLKQLTQFLKALKSGTRSLWYVDTGPVLERDLAQRAGLGFIGKHTNLISRKLGNWIFLSEIITTLPLEPDEPENNYCGSCTRCINACPTQAITGPFQLDARRCISYLTIELKGSIPTELRPLIGNRIYGCDDCLEACPWNRFAGEGQMMKSHQRTDLDTPRLIELLKLDDAEFKRRFAGTPMLRTKRRGLLRNVCVALGNVGDEICLPELSLAAESSEPLIAEHARWAIEQIKSRESAKSRN